MSHLVDYKGYQRVEDPTPGVDGGIALNANFTKVADDVETLTDALEAKAALSGADFSGDLSCAHTLTINQLVDQTDDPFVIKDSHGTVVARISAAADAGGWGAQYLEFGMSRGDIVGGMKLGGGYVLANDGSGSTQLNSGWGTKIYSSGKSRFMLETGYSSYLSGTAQGSVFVNASANDQPVLTLVGISSQIASFLEVRDYSGTLLSSMDVDGKLDVPTLTASEVISDSYKSGANTGVTVEVPIPGAGSGDPDRLYFTAGILTGYTTVPA